MLNALACCLPFRLTTCLSVYPLIIGGFIPQRRRRGLQPISAAFGQRTTWTGLPAPLVCDQRFL